MRVLQFGLELRKFFFDLFTLFGVSLAFGDRVILFLHSVSILCLLYLLCLKGNLSIGTALASCESESFVNTSVTTV